MSKPIPPVQKYMTSSPLIAPREQTLELAANLMRDHRIRHLPIVDGERIVGLLSARDIALVEAIEGANPKTMTVEAAMTPAPYTTDPSTPIDEVAAEMAEHKYGAAVIVQNGKVVGMFTAVDACLTLAEVFRGRLK